MSKLDKKARNALPDEHFAVPGKRKLPINDEHHTKLAWDMVERTQGLTPEEKKTARSRILKRAKDLGVDTKDWDKIKSMSIEAMSLNLLTDDHPNKMPFSGVLTKLDEPSDAPPGGANGKRIIVTSSAAEAALSSLLGMAVDFTPSFDGHDVQSKIGIITSADVVGNEVHIEGFVYAADFPETADMIQELKDALGFSFEAQRLRVEDMTADVLRITELTFTGAAILLKNKAAYTTTSLAASAEGDIEMTAEELKALLGPMLAEAIKPVTDRLTVVEQANATIVETVQANAATRAAVEPHCTALEGCAAAMEAAGIGNHATHGHVQVLNRMANSMRAEAAVGKVPHVFRDHDSYYAFREPGNTNTNEDELDMTKDEVTKLIASAVTEAVTAANKPLLDKIEAQEKTIKDQGEKLAAAETKLTDAANLRRLNAGSGAPERKTITRESQQLLSRAGINMPEEGKQLTVGEVDRMMSSAGLDMRQRIQLKTELNRVGALA